MNVPSKKEKNMNVRDVALMLKMPVAKVKRWVDQGIIPCKFKGESCYFRKKDILNWAETHGIKVNKRSIRESHDSDAVTLLRAIQKGGIFFDHEGRDVFSVLDNALNKMQLPEGVDKKDLLEKLLSREKIASTGIGKGVAIPHPRQMLDPAPDSSRITVFFLKETIDYQALDGQPVFVLFLMLSASTEEHLKLLAKLCFILRDEKSLSFLRSHPAESELFAAIKKFEDKLDSLQTR